MGTQPPSTHSTVSHSKNSRLELFEEGTLLGLQKRAGDTPYVVGTSQSLENEEVEDSLCIAL